MGGVNVGGNGGGRVGSESVATSDRCLSYYYSLVPDALAIPFMIGSIVESRILASL